MKEHQNNQDTYAQPDGAGSGNGAATILRAGSKPEASVGDLPGEADSGADSAGMVRDAADAAGTVLRAGQQALNRAEATTHAVLERSEAEDGASVLAALASCATRSTLRNVQAMSDLMHCRTLPGLVQWQSDLLTSTIVDWTATNARIFKLETRKA